MKVNGFINVFHAITNNVSGKSVSSTAKLSGAAISKYSRNVSLNHFSKMGSNIDSSLRIPYWVIADTETCILTNEMPTFDTYLQQRRLVYAQAYFPYSLSQQSRDYTIDSNCQQQFNLRWNFECQL